MANANKTPEQDKNELFDDSSFLDDFEESFFKGATTRHEKSPSSNRSTLNISALCCDEEISGYDKLTGKTWIYPTNYPVRDYQFNIIKNTLLKNTLVSLPTGLGKTFIAAVIMYNFYRWYPLGKIIFTAPTRPLVAQQIEACYNIIAIPPNDTIEMTGHMQVNTRKTHWQNKRVFFATPQVIYNDIKSGICPGNKIRCLVIDEAHRARGNYAYCQIVSTLTEMGYKAYRILALSATPGSKVEDVINIVKNLHIAHLELRTENCIDVSPYSHTRKISTVIIPLGSELTHLKQQYVEVLDGYARRLKQLNILPQNVGNLSKGRIVMLYKEYQAKERGARHPQHNYIMKDFTVLIALYHGLELLVKHGSRVFLNFFDEHPEKSWIQADDKLTAILERLRDDLGINPLSLNRSVLPDGSIPEMPKNLSFGHPKFDKLKEIMVEHFTKAKQEGRDTRAIVFCEYRESVNLVHCLLLQCRPLIMPQMFVGQGGSVGKDGAGAVSQRQQLAAMRAFRAGACTALVATCVAEEGLDVGSVDLILCFDISTRSPIRLVQRCGRTGRERNGQVYILVTEGKEHQTLLDCMRQRDGLNKKILQSKDVENSLYQCNPRMVPHEFTPTCQKMYITVAKKPDSVDGGEKTKKGQRDLRNMLLRKSPSNSSNSSNKGGDATDLITEQEYKGLLEDGYRTTSYLLEPQEWWPKSRESVVSFKGSGEEGRLKFSTWLEWQRSLQKTVNVGHSKNTEILTSLLQYSDAKRFGMPTSTQNPTFCTQDLATQNIKISPVKQRQSRNKANLIKSPNKRDGDIRALFSIATKSTTSYTKLLNDLGLQNNGNIPTRLINLLVDLNLNNIVKRCYICHNICDCNFLQNIKVHRREPPILSTFLNELKLPDITLIDDFDGDTLKSVNNIDEDQNMDDQNNKNVINLYASDKNNCSYNFELELDFDSLNNSFDNNEDNSLKFDNKERNFDIGNIEDICIENTPEVTQRDANDVEIKNYTDPKETLDFFGLRSIDDIFADSDDSAHENISSETLQKINNKEKKSNNDKNQFRCEYPLSPSILSGRKITNTSPILCSQVRKLQLSLKKRPQSSTPVSSAKKQLFHEPISNNLSALHDEIEQISPSVKGQNDISDGTNKSLFSVTQLLDIINKSDNNISKCGENHNSEDNRSTSPILLTQADKKKTMKDESQNIYPSLSGEKKSNSLIILDSDSDSNDTKLYDFENSINHEPSHANTEILESTTSQITGKRKLETDNDDKSIASPYFNKRQKLDKNGEKPLTLQEKVLAALSKSSNNNRASSNGKIVNFMMSPPHLFFQKENRDPQLLPNDKIVDRDEKEYIRKNNLEMLQIFRRDSNVQSPKKIFDDVVKNGSPLTPQKRKIFDSSDDDFVSDNDDFRGNKNRNASRKKQKKKNVYLDFEAEVSDDGNGASGDELSDDSVGSIVDFICDENVTHHEDMHAHYLKSIKSPIKGVFKIPQLPKKCNAEIFSQFVEEDNYEMDSFCVDSHIGLTQVNDVSELELAEIVLQEKLKTKKKNKRKTSSPEDNHGDSPVIRRKNKNARRLVESDLEDSS